MGGACPRRDGAKRGPERHRPRGAGFRRRASGGRRSAIPLPDDAERLGLSGDPAAGDPAAGTPVSWLLIDEGWEVVAAGGASAGRVARVVGDSARDIFSGLAVSAGLLGPTRFVPAESVVVIQPGRVQLDLPADAVAALDRFDEPPPHERIRP